MPGGLREHLRPLSLLLVWLAATGLFVAATGFGQGLELRSYSLDLAGPPSTVLSVDLDSDGIRDLVVALAFTEWNQIGFEESETMDEVEGLVTVMTVIPALMDRRELHVFLGRAEGGYSDRVQPLPLDLSILSIDHGSSTFPVVALTDDGVSALILDTSDSTLSWEPILDATPILARSASLVPNLGFSRDLNGDGERDLLLPVARGIEIFLSEESGEYRRSGTTVRLPGGRTVVEDEIVRIVPLPVLRDLDGNGWQDLLTPSEDEGWNDFFLFQAKGDGDFYPALRQLHGRDALATDSEESPNPDTESVVFFGDIDGDGFAEYLTEESLEDPDAGWRKEVKEAKRPPRRYRIYESKSDFGRRPEATYLFEATGYAFDLEDSDIHLPGGLRDLNGDGRLDLITTTLDFSLLQAVRMLTTQRITIGLDFFISCQSSSGQFEAVTENDLSGKFRINLKNLRLSELSQFAGDFDGDGNIDFLQMGRGRKATIHRGRSDCRYSPEPDLKIDLREPPLDLGLVQVRDLDGDALSDLMITQPQNSRETGATSPVRLDLYLSRRAP